MKLENLRPVLAVTNIEDTIRFYRDVLGFECVNQMDGWAALSKDGVEVMISLPNEHEPFDKPTLTGSIYFNTSDVDALWEQIKDKARIVYPIENFFYLRAHVACSCLSVRDNP